MKHMFEYIDNVNKSNIIVNYEIDNKTIKIKTGDNKDIVIEKKDSYIELLNGIISTQQKYQNLERKKELFSKETFNKKARLIMLILLFISISTLMLFPNIITSLLVLISIILLSTSQITHINNVLEIKKIDKSLTSKKTVIINDEYVIEDNKEPIEEVETVSLDDDMNIIEIETIYMDDEM